MGAFESIVVVILLLVVAGWAVHMLTTHVPMAAPFKETIAFIAVLLLVVWVLGILFGYVTPPRLPRFG